MAVFTHAPLELRASENGQEKEQSILNTWALVESVKGPYGHIFFLLSKRFFKTGPFFVLELVHQIFRFLDHTPAVKSIGIKNCRSPKARSRLQHEEMIGHSCKLRS